MSSNKTASKTAISKFFDNRRRKESIHIQTGSEKSSSKKYFKSKVGRSRGNSKAIKTNATDETPGN